MEAGEKMLVGAFKGNRQVIIIHISKNPLYRPVIKQQDIFEYEHLFPDFVCQFRFFDFQSFHNMFFRTSVYRIQNLYHCIYTTNNSVVLIYIIRKLEDSAEIVISRGGGDEIVV